MRVFVILIVTAMLSNAHGLIDMNLFVGGEGGYSCYRLPNLLQMRTPGHLVAIAQGHKNGCADSGQMDALIRTSTDNGKTWSDMALIYPNVKQQTFGTPTSVVDPTTDTIFLFLCVEFKQILLLSSTNGGKEWATPRDLTTELFPSNWEHTWYGTQQGITIDMGNGKQRLILCANHHDAGNDNGAHTVYSDDHGTTWKNGKTVAPVELGECALAQTSAGITMYARVVYDDSTDRPRRAIAFSTDYGETFTAGDTSGFPGNPGADAEGAFLSFNGKFLVGSPWGEPSTGRHNYTILVSDAVDGKVGSWTKLPSAAPLFAGQAEYSTMAVPTADNTTFFVIYERGDIYGGKGFLRLTQLAFPQ
jgi:sialidase-1